MLFNQAKKIISQHKKDLLRLGVRALALFGSVARNEGSPKSDVDVLIDFDPKKGLFDFMDIKTYLEELLDCEVDLVTKNALHPALKKTNFTRSKICLLETGSFVSKIFFVQSIKLNPSLKA